MKSYRPGLVPNDPAQLPGFLRAETQAIQKAATAPAPYIELQVMNVTPGKTLTGIFFGTGAPTFSAGQGSLYLRSDGSSTSTRAYVNTGGTGWTAVTTAT